MNDAFADRRDRLFGREADVHRLIDRAARPGLTALVARPLMGKTWTLTEVARRLLEEGRYVVGYHESKAAESSHLLYAVSDLYARWLMDSSMREQAISLWKRHRDNLVPRVGQIVGTIFDKLGNKSLGEGLGALVRSAFDGLAEAQKDLQSGGIHIAPLPYDEALSLAKLIADVSKRRIVLILDAWEKSPSLGAEFATLEAFLRHHSEWPHTHIFAAIRDPDLASAKRDAEANQRAHDLCKISRAAHLYELKGMALEDLKERARIISFVRNKVPAAREQAETSILAMVDGYPGVLDFWTHDANRIAMQTEQDLQLEADNAQALRYLEMDRLLVALQEPARTVAGRLAFFPGLDAKRWAFFRELLLNGQSEDYIHELVDCKVLDDERFPTYGHDTRHVAARRWFMEYKRPLLRRIAEQLIETLAVRITGIDITSLPYFEALVGCSEPAREIATELLSCLLDAAKLAVGDFAGVTHSQFDLMYPGAVRHNSSFAPLIAISLISRGATKSELGDRQGAIMDCTAAIELCGAPAKLVAQALVNRGLSKIALSDHQGALADFTAAIKLPGAPADQVTWALYNRGVIKGQLGDYKGAIINYTAAIKLPGAPASPVAQALVNRGRVKGRLGDSKGAIADYTAVITLRGAPTDQVAKALYNRGARKGMLGDRKGEIADYTTVITLHGAPDDAVAKALFNRGVRKGQRGDSKEAIEDFTAVIQLAGAPTDRVAEALANRGVTKDQLGNREGAIEDFTAVTQLAGAPSKVVDAVRKYLQEVTRPE